MNLLKLRDGSSPVSALIPDSSAQAVMTRQSSSESPNLFLTGSELRIPLTAGREKLLSGSSRISRKVLRNGLLCTAFLSQMLKGIFLDSWFSGTEPNTELMISAYSLMSDTMTTMSLGLSSGSLLKRSRISS